MLFFLLLRVPSTDVSSPPLRMSSPLIFRVMVVRPGKAGTDFQLDVLERAGRQVHGPVVTAPHPVAVVLPSPPPAPSPSCRTQVVPSPTSPSRRHQCQASPPVSWLLRGLGLSPPPGPCPVRGASRAQLRSEPISAPSTSKQSRFCSFCLGTFRERGLTALPFLTPLPRSAHQDGVGRQ